MTPNCFGAATISSDCDQIFSCQSFLGDASQTPGCASFTPPALMEHLNPHTNMCIILCDNTYTFLYLCECSCILIYVPPFELNSDKWTPLTTQDSADNFCSTTRPPSKAVTPCAQSQSIHSYLSLRSKLHPSPPKSNFWSYKEKNSISSIKNGC